MAKKNTPDAAGKGSNAEGAQPKKRSKFISEFDMWDINLDISSDDTIDPTVRSGERAKDSTSTQPIRPVESRAKTTPLPTRSTKPPVNKPSAKPAITNKAAARPNKPQVQPSQVRRNTATRGAAPSHAQHTARQSIDPRIAKPRNQATPASQQPLPKMRAETQQSRRDAAVFTTRDVNRYIIPQNVNQVDELQKKRRNQKIVKSVSWLWSVVKFVWGVLDSIVSFLFKVSPRLYQNKALVVTALVSFFAGFFLGGFTSGTKVADTPTQEMVSSTQTHAHVSKRKTKHKRSARKRAERHVAPKRVTKPQPSVAQDNVLPDSNREPSNADTQNPNQFAGKEIPIGGSASDAGSESSAMAENGAPADSTAGPNGTATQSQSEAKATQGVGGNTASQDSKASVTADDAEFNRLQNLNLKYFNQKQWQKVVATSIQMLNLKPFTESALINRSVAYTELDQYTLAINDANTLIAMNKHNGVAFNNRAYAYEKGGNLIKALADYTKACDLGVQQSCNDMNRMKHNLSRKN